MRSISISLVGGLVVPLVVAAGCDVSAPPPPPKNTSQVATHDLPKLGDYMSPLDNGRVEIAPPAGWTIGSRSRDCIVRFRGSSSEQYPLILVTGEDCPSMSNVSPENVEKFAQEIKKEESVNLVKPITIGDFVGVAYRKRGKEPKSINRILERLFVVTVVSGRKYGIELRTREGMLEEGQKPLFAVAKGIKFTDVPTGEGKPDAADAAEAKPTGKSKKELAKQSDDSLEELEELLK